MGLGNNIRPIYLQFADGKVVQTFKEPTAKSKERVNKNGKKVHEEHHDYITGYIVKAGVTEHEDYGKFFNVVLKDDESDQLYTIQMGLSSAYASAFLKAIPNADVQKVITLIPHMKMVDDQKKVSLFVSQYGKALKHFFTKDNPNGMPGPVKVRVKGVDTWDYFDQTEFLVDNYFKNIQPKIGTPPMAAKIDEQLSGSSEALTISDIENEPINSPLDDLPF